MTVKELIKKLQEYPENMEVFSYGQPCSGNILEATAMKILPVLKYVVKDETGAPQFFRCDLHFSDEELIENPQWSEI